MTTADIKEILLAVDPDVQRYDHDRTGSDAYTVWQELKPVGCYGDGREVGTIRFEVNRFTKEEDDAIAEALLDALEARDDITVDWTVDYEKDTEYIRHIFTCEGI